jgi:hypothetical protein
LPLVLVFARALPLAMYEVLWLVEAGMLAAEGGKGGNGKRRHDCRSHCMYVHTAASKHMSCLYAFLFPFCLHFLIVSPHSPFWALCTRARVIIGDSCVTKWCMQYLT